MSESVAGAGLLAEWLNDNTVSMAEAGRKLGVSHVSVWQWLNTTSRPRHHLREAIERWTGGAVSASSWMTEAEAADLERAAAVEPHTGPDAA